jgi:hypothetical protein
MTGREAAGKTLFTFPPTDRDGRTTLQCGIAPLTIGVLPKRLQDREAQAALWRDRGSNPDPVAVVELRLGQVQPRAGETVTVDLHLPADW